VAGGLPASRRQQQRRLKPGLLKEPQYPREFRPGDETHSMLPLLVLSTFPDADTARRIVRICVEERLAACGNLIPGVESIYRWKGKVETATEILVVFKTTSESYPKLEARIVELHPYEVPEVVAIPPSGGLPSYMEWIVNETGEPDRSLS
jgi:periplasmic divalent cation tolerance protein